jgi:hypothetical protein
LVDTPSNESILKETRLTPLLLKKALVAQGFEVFRTLKDEIVLAERVRENLILDSGIRVKAFETEDEFEVRLVLRAEKSDFPSEEDDELFQRVRALAAPALELGYVEVSTAVSPVTDPSNAETTLDTFYELFLLKKISGGMDVVSAEVRRAQGLTKTVPHTH